jgi:3-dehydroquinate synthase
MPAPSRTVRVSLTRTVDDSYDILIRPGLLAEIAADLAEARFGQAYALICDSTTEKLFGRRLLSDLTARGLPARIFGVPAGEASKSIETFAGLLASLKAARFTRKDCVIALGGGMVGDLSGFVAGCYMRGLPFVQIPTTLLAQVDSSVGGKVAVNVKDGKNYCGLFHQPRRVYIDPTTLSSLPRDQLLSGLAEVLKHALIADRSFYDFLLENAPAVLGLAPEAVSHLVATSCAIKARVVEADEREAGLRMILNYGHTIGHAVEDAMAYALPHGQCVAYGMRVVARAARDLGFLPEPDYQAHETLLDAYGLATEPLRLDPDRIMTLALGDKKAGRDRLVFVVPRAIGRVEIRDDLDPAAVTRALSHILA